MKEVSLNLFRHFMSQLLSHYMRLSSTSSGFTRAWDDGLCRGWSTLRFVIGLQPTPFASQPLPTWTTPLMPFLRGSLRELQATLRVCLLCHAWSLSGIVGRPSFPAMRRRALCISAAHCFEACKDAATTCLRALSGVQRPPTVPPVTKRWMNVARDYQTDIAVLRFLVGTNVSMSPLSILQIRYRSMSWTSVLPFTPLAV